MCGWFLLLVVYVCIYELFIYSSAIDTLHNMKVAIKKLARPFQSAVHAKRTYRELRMLKHMNHENVIGECFVLHFLETGLLKQVGYITGY